jgi:urea transporter
MRPPLTPLLKRPPANDWAMALLSGCSQIFLLRHPLCGLLCLLSIAWGAPQLLGGVLLGAFTGWLTAVRRHYPQPDINSGLYGYNGALLGLLLSAKLAWSPLLPLLIIASAGLSSLLLRRWLRHNRRHASLPAYTAPFVLLSWLLLALAEPLQLTHNAASPSQLYGLAALDLPQAVLRGLSQVLLVNDPLSGLLIFIALWLANRRMALWALAGSTLGLLLASQLGQYGGAVQGLYGFNGALVAVALSQQQRRPWALLTGIIASVLLQLGWVSLGLSNPLTAPFILACWLVQAVQALWQGSARGLAGR